MDHTQFQIGELHSRFNVMRVNLQSTNNNLNDLNMNYNCQSSTLLDKINQLDNKLTISLPDSGPFQCEIRGAVAICYWAIADRRVTSINKNPLDLVDEDAIHLGDCETNDDFVGADLVDSSHHFEDAKHIYKRYCSSPFGGPHWLTTRSEHRLTRDIRHSSGGSTQSRQRLLVP